MSDTAPKTLPKIRTFADDYAKSKPALPTEPAAPVVPAPKQTEAPRPEPVIRPAAVSTKTDTPTPILKVVSPKSEIPQSEVKKLPEKEKVTITLPQRPTPTPPPTPVRETAPEKASNARTIASFTTAKGVQMDDISEIDTGNIIRETKRQRFRLFPAIAASLRAWFSGVRSRAEERAESTPKVEPVADRKEKLVKAATFGVLPVADDHKRVTVRLKDTATPTPSIGLSIVEGDEPAPRWSSEDTANDELDPEAQQQHEAAIRELELAVTDPDERERREPDVKPAPVVRTEALTDTTSAQAVSTARGTESVRPEPPVNLPVAEPAEEPTPQPTPASPTVDDTDRWHGAAVSQPSAPTSTAAAEPTAAPSAPAVPAEPVAPVREPAPPREPTPRPAPPPEPESASEPLPAEVPTYEPEPARKPQPVRETPTVESPEPSPLERPAAAQPSYEFAPTPAQPAIRLPLLPIAVIIGAVGLGLLATAAIFFMLQGPAQSPTPDVASSVPAQKRIAVPLTPERAEFTAAMTAALSNENELTLYYPVVATGEGTVAPASVNELLAVLALQAPGSLTRSFTEVSFAQNGDEQPFILIKINSFDTAFGGMLLWERSLSSDLAFWFGSEPASSFSDTTFDNRDLRIARRASGNDLMYTFLDRTTILITTSRTVIETYGDQLR